MNYPRIPVGGVYIPGAKSIEGATGDIARTTAGYIEDRKYIWFATGQANSWSAEFDTAVTRTGSKTLKMSNTDTSGRGWTSVGDPMVLTFCPVVKPSTEYTLNYWIKTNNVASASGGVKIDILNSVGGSGGSSTYSARISGTVDWTLVSTTFTTSSTTYYIGLNLLNNVAGNVSDAWFDCNSMTLVQSNVTRNPIA